MKRLWSRVGVRVTSVGLLVAGVVGGVHLGQLRDVRQHGTEAQMVVQADAEEIRLLKSGLNDHAADRARRQEAESDAAAMAAVEATKAASRAHTLEKKAAKAKAEAKAEAEAKKKAEEAEASGGTVPYAGKIPTSCKEYSGNRATGCALMLDAGFAIDQFPCLNKLWNKESGWNAHASNSGSGAYGIPQALPGSKMGSAGSDWKTNPATQITWGLGYIAGRYNTPCGAWSHSERTGSY
ncbi:lytic transglycosylase domain-containing protein [Mangrovihabitans endophyticus]|uniref:aggregation-promoting factor C-terminal-like domain-containing protein n=1 Tax=Mangrovihabitans endophyticus TaxID=1751298 RepID=UPI001665DEB0|nr:lytic transglycosylase domain-containing protein [Mangrovihabitans endophyticus]